jgi:hypothetical protein
MGLLYIYIYIYTCIYNHSHHRSNVPAPSGRPKLRRRLHFGHKQEGGPRSVYGHLVALGGGGDITYNRRPGSSIGTVTRLRAGLSRVQIPAGGMSFPLVYDVPPPFNFPPQVQLPGRENGRSCI